MPKNEEKKEEPKPKKQTLKEGHAAFEKMIEAAGKMRRTGKINAMGNALSAFARMHGTKEANELHKKYNLAGEGLHRVSES